VASDEITAEQLVKHAREAILGSGEELDDAVFGRLVARMSYVSGDAMDGALYRRLAAEIGGRQRPLYYLEVPPSLFGPIVEHLASANLLRDGRVAVEKPFGHDLDSARALDARLHRTLSESQILRVDHFLGKEPVIGLEYLRFANFALAELWDRKSVSCVQITMAEDFGIEGRGAFYDSVGALRDVVQNHLLQVLALVAMDPPAGGSADDTQDKKAEVFRAMLTGDPRHWGVANIGVCRRPRVARGSPPRHTWRCAGDRQLALGGRAHLLAGWQGAAGSRHRGATAPAPHSPALLPSNANPGGPEPDRPSDRPGSRHAAGTVRAGQRVVAHGPSGRVVHPRARRTGRAIRAAPAGRARRRPSVVRPAGRRRGDVAHRAAVA
jgi:hypothetical protein